MNFQCPFCQSIVSVDNSDCGISVQCGSCGEVTTAPTSRISSGVVIGNDFIILEEIGRGGMGVVFLAHQISLDRRTALKILSPRYASNNEFITGFIKEARAAAKLNHPHIVQAYAVGEEDGIYYFAMEFVDGETMKSVLKRENIIPVDKALVIIQQVAEALDYAWKEQQLIHRDIKPDNIMLTKNGRAKLADLGLAKFAGEIDDANKDEVMGTPQYISPEHLTGMPMDIRSDIYSLGATFFHLVTGRFAFTGKDAVEIARKHIEEPLENPRAVNPAIPESVAAIIIRMMEKNPDARYQSAEELAEDIRMVRRGKAPAGGLAKPGTGGLVLRKPSPSGRTQASKTLTLTTQKTPSGTDLKTPGYSGIGLGTHSEIHPVYSQSTTSAIRKRKEKKAKMQVMLAGVAILICILGAAGFFIFQAITKKEAPKTKKTAKTAQVKPGQTKPGEQKPASPVQTPGATSSQPAAQTEIQKKLAEINALNSQSPVPKEQILNLCDNLFNSLAGAEPQDEADKNALESIKKIYAPLDEERKALAEEASKKQQEEELERQKKEEEARKAEEQQRLAEEAQKREAENKRLAEEAKKREAEEKELQRKEEYRKSLAKEKDNLIYRAMLATLKKDFDSASKGFDSALSEKNKTNVPSPEDAKKFSDWAAMMQNACKEAKKFNEKFFNCDTIIAGQKMELAIAPKKTEYLSIVKINNGEITVKDSSGKVFKALPITEQPSKQFRMLVSKVAKELNMTTEPFYFLLMRGEFELAKDFALNEDLKTLLSDIATSYIKQYLKYNPGDIKTMRTKYGRLEEFKKAISPE